LRVLDNCKVNNGNSCAVCHTTEMRVNSYRLFAPMHGTAREKIFYFRKGTNYPVSLNELINDIPRPNNNTGSPATTETYAAELLASKTNLPPQFFVTDAGNRLGSNRVWLTSFPTPAQNPVGTLTVPRIDILFTNVIGNTPLDVNSNWNGGMRVFPDQLSPTDMTARNVVRVRITTTPAMPGKQVRLKSFDVDDATSTNFDSEFLIDTNDVSGVKGNDNRGTPQAGTLASTLLTLDGTGTAETQLTLPMQPGDNLRVAALFETNNAQTHLDSLQVTNANAAFYVTNSSDQIKDFLGSVSPMLTVWRKLHLEIDSMEAVATTGAEANFQTGFIDRYQANAPVSGQSMVNLDVDLRGGSGAYENGQMIITNVGTFNVVKNNARFVVGDDVILSATPGTNVIGKSFKIYDDDDRFLSTIGLPPALPKDNESTNIVAGIRAVFLPAYIEVTNANAEGFNTNKIIVFKRNAAMSAVFGAGVFDDAKDLHDRSSFWTHTINFGFQPENLKNQIMFHFACKQCIPSKAFIRKLFDFL
ncbi:MAG: hypothetical protein ABJC04_13290, partial [Verrucomicrobiota bacterium]